MRVLAAPNSGHPAVVLRQLERSDANDWYAYLALPEVFQHTSWNLDSAKDLSRLFDLFDSPSADSERRLAIVDKLHGRLIGTIGFHAVSSANITADIFGRPFRPNAETLLIATIGRSEERRVGKEGVSTWRSRWAPY